MKFDKLGVNVNELLAKGYQVRLKGRTIEIITPIAKYGGRKTRGQRKRHRELRINISNERLNGLK
ncbi:hypothetical protein HNQ85_001294 [Anoxybacillus calidus]|jgi:hypothetical protein|uniref:Uncharacterized protein n=1 Tax=[Anoxybacillus] calidus TaxID=575178 RepID=A0A7V9YYY6_9BACL|nr:hypothetical protein [Anoxybacillus calidus]MBA2871024.1 hypothetical protein [Anoxybacillus calidus]